MRFQKLNKTIQARESETFTEKTTLCFSLSVDYFNY